MLRAWLLLLGGLMGLIAMRAAYDATWEPAPGVRVRWREGTTDARRAQLEHHYRLVEPSAPQGLSFSYVLLDTSRRNIEALVKDPEAADTNDIDRRRFEVPFETTQYSRRIMWVADRIPGLRQPVMRWAVAAAFAAMTAAGGIRVGRRMVRRG